MTKEVQIRSLQEYVNAILTYKKELIWNCQKHECMLFRGQCDKEYELLPSIARGQRFATSGSLMEEERNLIESAKFRLPDVFNRSYEPIELLALLQHYGIPTRLLDVTENAFVALFFACGEQKEKNAEAEVIIFRHDEKDIANYPIINAIAESYKFLKGTTSPFGAFLNKAVYQNYFREQYSFFHDLLESFKGEDGCKTLGRYMEEDYQPYYFVLAPNRSTRQMLQSGRYILFSNAKIDGSGEEPSHYFEKTIKPMPKDAACIMGRIIISNDCKERLLNELSVFGITKGKLFGDSVDTACGEIKENWSRASH